MRPAPLSMEWWHLIATACGHIAEHHPEEVPAVEAWLDQMEAGFEADDALSCRRMARELPAPIRAVLGTAP